MGMSLNRVRKSASSVVCVVCAVTLVILSSLVLPQTKPECPSKGRRPPEVKPSTPSSESEGKASDKEDSESSRPGGKVFKGMKYRLIGPFRGGRSLTAAGIPGDPTTYYFGATGGGVWKSTDGAMTWSSVFDKEGTSSIGSIAVSNSNHNVIYVGTGEA